MNTDVDVNILIQNYHNKISTLYNQNILLEVKIQSLTQDYAKEKEVLILIVDPADFPAVYNDYWLKKYLTASIKRQWGQNLTKFNGVQLPGGITLNGDKIYADAEKELEEVERQLRDEYELPPLGLIG
jgi:hypothetical protein